VLLVGAGGLGGPIAYALSAAGVGGLTICDPDTVELSNLQRQIQFITADVGAPKAARLADELGRRGYDRARVSARAEAFTPASAASLAADADLLIDGSDNLATKFAVNDAAVVRGVPCVIAGVDRYGGHVLALRPDETGCYRCLFEEPPDEEPASCAQAGVLGAAVAVIAGAAARAALALARGDVAGAASLEVFDDLRVGQMPRIVRYNRRDDCAACRRARPERARPARDRNEEA
jgi:molybdopterin/thiamine biosynthesis adenylyltransferase